MRGVLIGIFTTSIIVITSVTGTDTNVDVDDWDAIPHPRFQRDYGDAGGPLALKPPSSSGAGNGINSGTKDGAPPSAAPPATSNAGGGGGGAIGGPAAGSGGPVGGGGGGIGGPAAGSGPAGGGSATSNTQPAPANNGKPAGRSCAISVVPSSVLTDISLGKASLPNFNLKFIDSCKSIADCGAICEKASCNYFMRSNGNGLAYFYTVNVAQLSPAHFTDSVFYDSFVPQCAPGGTLNNEGSVDNSGNNGGNSASGSSSSGGDNGQQSISNSGSGLNGDQKTLNNGQNQSISRSLVSNSQLIPPTGTGDGSRFGNNIGVGNNGNNGQPVLVDRCPECIEKDKFKEFLLTNNKSYPLYEEERRFDIYQMSQSIIDELNEKRTTDDDAKFGVTKFSDRLFGEFVQKFTGAIKEDKPADEFVGDISVVPGVPKKFDWRDEGVVPPIRYQAECGSCYAFSTADTTGIQYAVDRDQHNQSYLLAPQVILDCVRSPSAFGCNGGRPFLVLRDMTNCSECFWPRESCYPYQNQATECRAPTLGCIDADKPNIKVTKANYMDVSAKEEAARMAALLLSGPSVALVEVTEHWQHYTGGVMRSTQCQKGSEQPNHAVVIVGYDFTAPVPYYVIRNTWGDDWGEGGYFRLEADKNSCGIGQYLSFACTADDCADDVLERARRRQLRTGHQVTTTASPYVPPPLVTGYGAETPPPTPYNQQGSGQPPSASPPPPPTAAPGGEPTPGPGELSPTDLGVTFTLWFSLPWASATDSGPSIPLADDDPEAADLAHLRRLDDASELEQVGLEPSSAEHASRLVTVIRRLRRAFFPD